MDWACSVLVGLVFGGLVCGGGGAQTAGMSRRLKVGRGVAAGLLLAVGASCVGERVLRIESEPPGATVRLDDRVIGVTPIEVEFLHYGQRRLALYRTGYRTYSEPLKLKAPWFARWPVDMLTEVIMPLGLDDVRTLKIDLVEDAGSEAAASIEEFEEHARRARSGDLLEGVPIAGQDPEESE